MHTIDTDDDIKITGAQWENYGKESIKDANEGRTAVNIQSFHPNYLEDVLSTIC
jgi:hypothetical protein